MIERFEIFISATIVSAILMFAGYGLIFLGMKLVDNFGGYGFIGFLAVMSVIIGVCAAFFHEKPKAE